jgi:hypothetical protein
MPADEATYEAHHADNQRRFIAIEVKLDANTQVTEKLASDTAELVEMWKDAGVFFKWMRRAGGLLIWVGKIASAALILLGIPAAIQHFFGGVPK